MGLPGRRRHPTAPAPPYNRSSTALPPPRPAATAAGRQRGPHFSGGRQSVAAAMTDLQCNRGWHKENFSSILFKLRLFGTGGPCAGGGASGDGDDSGVVVSRRFHSGSSAVRSDRDADVVVRKR